jgi:glycosyltransferase involved in cell wall biosynthesis
MNDFLKPKISIIVPFYNEERFIGKCAESVLSQTMNDTELIFVNEGSEDNSLEILRSLVTNDQRARIDTHPTRNISRSTQFAVERAHGDYIMFVDPDDYLHTDACRILYRELVSSEVDILHYNNTIFGDVDDTVTEEVRKRARPFYGELVDGDIIYGCFGSRIYHHALWNKVFRASIVRGAFKRLPSDYSSYADDYLAYFLIAMGSEKYKGIHTDALYYRRLSTCKVDRGTMTGETIRTMCNMSAITNKLSDIVADSDNAPFYGELIKLMRASSLADILQSWRRFKDYAEA